MASEPTASNLDWTPPYPPSDPTDKSSFSYETVLKRWPIIITGLIDRVYRDNHATLSSSPSPSSDEEDQEEDEEELDEEEKKAKVEEGKAVIARAGKLKYEMARDRALDPIPTDDGAPLASAYNARLAQLEAAGRNTWFTAPWLFAECYLYRVFRGWFAQTKYWTTYDPFRAQKVDAFRSSGAAVYKLANTMHELSLERAALLADRAKLEILFKEMLQICLWGNATDLSLLTNLTHEDIQKLQTVEKDAQAARAAFILRDDADAAWAQLSGMKDGRVDIVLDNSGFELFTDFIFADFLLTYTPFVSKVVFQYVFSLRPAIYPPIPALRTLASFAPRARVVPRTLPGHPSLYSPILRARRNLSSSIARTHIVTTANSHAKRVRAGFSSVVPRQPVRHGVQPQLQRPPCSLRKSRTLPCVDHSSQLLHPSLLVRRIYSLFTNPLRRRTARPSSRLAVQRLPSARSPPSPLIR